MKLHHAFLLNHKNHIEDKFKLKKKSTSNLILFEEDTFSRTFDQVLENSARQSSLFISFPYDRIEPRSIPNLRDYVLLILS